MATPRRLGAGQRSVRLWEQRASWKLCRRLHPVSFLGPSGNKHFHRIAAAQLLREMIAAHPFAPEERLNIIAHSHGGNVALAASHLGLAQPIDTLITLNKPTLLGEAYVPGNNIENFYNISAARDWIQWAASDVKMMKSFAKDESAVNHTIDTSSSNIKPHAALIWDDRFRDMWWEWFKNQSGASATGEAG